MKYKFRGKILYRIIAMLLVVTTLGANTVQISYASLDGEMVCELSEHTHTQEQCYEKVSELTCGIEENSVHVHGEACYQKEQALICPKTECEAHAHEAGCYAETTVLTCGLQESVGHTHEDLCYDETGVLVCTLEETEGHQHSDACNEPKTVQICGKEETAGHAHSQECYTEQSRLICSLEENVPHVHQEGCYTNSWNLTCKKTEHTHVTACYAASEISGEPVEPEVTEDLLENETPVCTCFTETEIHAETCPLYQENLLLGAFFSTSMTPFLDAAIYSDSYCTTLETSLTGTQNSFSNWEYDTTRYIKIELGNIQTTVDAPYQLVIEMDPILYLDLTSDPTLQNATVSFVRNDAITVNSTGTYTPKTYSLKTLTYQLSEDIGSCSFTLPVRYDNGLWNHLENASLGDGTNPLLQITLQQTSEGTISDVTGCSAVLHQATTGSEMPNSRQARLQDSAGNDQGLDISLRADESTTMYVSQMQNSSYNEGHFYDVGDLQIVLQLPSATIGETTYTMDYAEKFPVANGTANYTETLEAGIVTFDFGKTFYRKNSLVQIEFNFKEADLTALQEVKDPVDFQGRITVTTSGKTLINNTFTVTLDNSTAPVFSAHTCEGDANIYDLDTVQYLGAYGISNTGGDSNKVTVHLEFDPQKTGAFGVTTVLVMAPPSVEMEIPVQYTLTNHDGSEVTGELTLKKTSSNTDKHILVNRSNLPEEYRTEYYFKEIKYVLEKVPADAVLYNTSAAKSHSCAGSFWGYILNGEVNKYEAATAKLLDEQGVEIDGMTKTIALKVKDTTTSSYGLNGASLDKTAIVAGGSVTLKGRVFTVEYPYTANNCLNDIRLGLLLPEGMTVVSQSIHATFTNGEKLEVAEVIEPTDENPLWTVVFAEGEKIGYANESLGPIPNGSAVNFSMQLNTSTLMPSHTLDIQQSVFVAGYGRINGASGSYQKYNVKDQYDLNGNGSKTDSVGCFASSTKLTITPAPAVLDISSTLTKDGATGDTIVMNSFSDKIWYNVNIQCTRGGSAEDFLYMIPIVDELMETESDYVVKNEASLKLVDPAIISNKAGTDLDVLYTTVAFAGYLDAKNSSDAVWWRENEKPTGVDWEDVTFLKVVVAPEMQRSVNTVIVNGTDVTISLPLGFDGEELDFPSYAGAQIVWHSRGYYDYTLGVQMAADNSSPKVTVELQYEEFETRNVILTAAKDHSPIGNDSSGNPAEAVKSFTLPEMKLPQGYSIQEVSTNGVTLVGSNADFSTLDNAAANETFAVKVTVSGGGKSYTADLLKEKKITLGNPLEDIMPGNTMPEFTFEIYNADILTEAIADRYITFTIVGDGGILIPVKVSIERQLARAEASDPAIIAGKEYGTFNAGEAVTISQDAAFTAQFIANDLVPDLYSTRTLSFGSAPTQGTTIAMIDWTDEDHPEYYYYKQPANGGKQIELTQFVKMGTAGTAYSYPTGGTPVKETFLFIVQIPESGEPARDNTISLTRTFEKTSETNEEETQTLAFTTKLKRSFDLSVEQGAQTMGAEFELSYTTVASEGSETRYQGKRVLVIGASGNGTLPAEARIVTEGKTYLQNADGYIVIPFNEMEGDSIQAQFIAETASQCTLTVALWVSATDKGNKPFMGHKFDEVTSITFKQEADPSLKVTGMTPRLIHREALKDVIHVTYETKSLTNANSPTIEVQKKDGEGYVTQTNVLNAVNGSTTHEQGAFAVSTKGGTLKIALLESMDAGTYRIIFKVTDHGEVVEIPYGFIVIE